MISFGAKIDVHRGSVFIGNNCTITHGTVILSHDTAAHRLKQYAKSEAKTIIRDGVYIGVNSVILPGVVIGSNSIVGAGSIVTKDIPSNAIAVGNPANVIKNLDPPL